MFWTVILHSTAFIAGLAMMILGQVIGAAAVFAFGWRGLAPYLPAALTLTTLGGIVLLSATNG